MKRRGVRALCFLALIILGAVGFSAAASNEKPPYVGIGPHISLLGSPVQYVAADSPFHIDQGWVGPRYPGSVPYMMLEPGRGIVNMGGVLFELYVDGVEVHLGVLNRNFDETVFRSWYAQFDAGDLAPGEHEITGVWSSRNPQSKINVLDEGLSRTIKLVVVP